MWFIKGSALFEGIKGCSSMAGGEGRVPFKELGEDLVLLAEVVVCLGEKSGWIQGRASGWCSWTWRQLDV